MSSPGMNSCNNNPFHKNADDDVVPSESIDKDEYIFLLGSINIFDKKRLCLILLRDVHLFCFIFRVIKDFPALKAKGIFITAEITDPFLKRNLFSKF